MLRSVVLFATLFAFYVALSGQIHNGFLMTAGLISAGAITVLARQLEICDEEGVPYERTLAALRYRYPSERLPDGQTTSGWLRELTFRGARERYGGTIPDDVRRQLDRELDLVDELDYCG